MAAVVRTTSCAASEAWIAGGAVRRCAGASRVLSAIAESTPSSRSSVICRGRSSGEDARLVRGDRGELRVLDGAGEGAREIEEACEMLGAEHRPLDFAGRRVCEIARDEPLRCEGGLAMWGSGAATARARCRRGGDLPESIAARSLGRPQGRARVSRCTALHRSRSRHRRRWLRCFPRRGLFSRANQ